MRKFEILSFVLVAQLLACCEGRSASDAATTPSQANGTGSSSSNGGNANSSMGGSNQSQSGTNGTQAARGGAFTVGGTSGTGSCACFGGSCGADACAAANANCGSIIDGCGIAQDCGTCAAGITCGGTVPNQCDTPCLPLTVCPANFSLRRRYSWMGESSLLRLTGHKPLTRRLRAGFG